MCRNGRSSKSRPSLEKEAPIGRCPGPLERRRLDEADSLDMSKIGRNCAIVIGASMQEQPWLSGNGRGIHLHALKQVLTTLHEQISMLTVPAPGQSN
jgi:hypothetical protein